MTTISVALGNRTRQYVQQYFCFLGCPKLKCFISKGCKLITSRAVICLARHCNQLEVVNLLGCCVSF